MTILALILTAGLLARWMLSLHRENVALRNARRRSASITRRLKRHRDALSICLEQAGDEYQEMRERCESLEEELAEFRREEAILDAANRAAVLMRFN